MYRLLGIEHRTPKFSRPCTNGQAERIVRTLKQATVRAFHSDRIHALRRPVADYLTAYSFAKQLKALRWQTPAETLDARWRTKPQRFHVPPGHLTLGPNT